MNAVFIWYFTTNSTLYACFLASLASDAPYVVTPTTTLVTCGRTDLIISHEIVPQYGMRSEGLKEELTKLPLSSRVMGFCTTTV